MGIIYTILRLFKRLPTHTSVYPHTHVHKHMRDDIHTPARTQYNDPNKIYCPINILDSCDFMYTFSIS